MTVEIKKYEGILFSFASMLKEIEGMSKLARPFLDRDAVEFQIPQWLGELKRFRDRKKPGDKLTWQIPSDRPISTKLSEGEYEPSGKGMNCLGTFSCIWEIELPKQEKGSGNKAFLLTGIASSKTTVLTDATDETAVWNFEIGDINSPGCHFHSQITLDDANGRYPSELSVPRLPAIPHTPMDALDFLLGELFQLEWREHSAKENDYQKLWSHCQSDRFLKLLAWQSKQIQTATGSPWAFMKKQKPPMDLFVS